MESIWTTFKNELGFATVSIQYLELSRRVVEAEHVDELKQGKIVDLAKRFRLSISVASDDIHNRIAKNYIAQVHSCVEKFLKDYHGLVGSSTYGLKYDAEEDSDYLNWTMTKAFANKSSDYDEQYRICNYYRLVRNDSVHHDEKTSAKLKMAFSQISRYSYEKLHAPNSIEALSFDDQVLFSRSAKQLLGAIYFQSQYDWSVIISKHKSDIEPIISSCKHDTSKAKQKIENYLRRAYPIPPQGIDGIADML